MNRLPSRPTPATNRRRGSLFHYYMMYLALSSVLLTTAGLSIHAILKADRVDALESRHLKTLLRLDGLLRDDADASQLRNSEVKLLSLTHESGTNIRWTIDENMLNRETFDDEQKRLSSDRLVFRKGTKIRFRHEEDTRRVVLSLNEASPVPADDSKPKGDATEDSRVVEMQVLFRDGLTTQHSP